MEFSTSKLIRLLSVVKENKVIKSFEVKFSVNEHQDHLNEDVFVQIVDRAERIKTFTSSISGDTKIVKVDSEAIDIINTIMNNLDLYELTWLPEFLRNGEQG